MRRIRAKKGAAEHISIVTTAASSQTDDRHQRQRRYAITQGVRLACFVLAVVLPLPLPVKLVMLAAALLLPLLGVVAANGGPVVERKREANAIVDRPDVVVVETTGRFVIDSSRVVDAER